MNSLYLISIQLTDQSKWRRISTSDAVFGRRPSERQDAKSLSRAVFSPFSGPGFLPQEPVASPLMVIFCFIFRARVYVHKKCFWRLSRPIFNVRKLFSPAQ